MPSVCGPRVSNMGCEFISQSSLFSRSGWWPLSLDEEKKLSTLTFFFFFNSSDAYEWNRSGLLMCLWDVLGAVSVKPTSHLRSFSFKKLFSGLTPSISLACCRKGVNGEKSNMGECHENEVREWLRGGVPQGREWPRTVLIALESYTQMKGHESRTTASWALVIRPSSFMSWVRHRI